MKMTRELKRLTKRFAAEAAEDERAAAAALKASPSLATMTAYAAAARNCVSWRVEIDTFRVDESITTTIRRLAQDLGYVVAAADGHVLMHELGTRARCDRYEVISISDLAARAAAVAYAA